MPLCPRLRVVGISQGFLPTCSSNPWESLSPLPMHFCLCWWWGLTLLGHSCVKHGGARSVARGGLTLPEARGLVSLCLGDARVTEEGFYRLTLCRRHGRAPARVCTALHVCASPGSRCAAVSNGLGAGR